MWQQRDVVQRKVQSRSTISNAQHQQRRECSLSRQQPRKAPQPKAQTTPQANATTFKSKMLTGDNSAWRGHASGNVVGHGLDAPWLVCCLQRVREVGTNDMFEVMSMLHVAGSTDESRRRGHASQSRLLGESWGSGMRSNRLSHWRRAHACGLVGMVEQQDADIRYLFL